ncbi:MAG: helix-turn-helix domain-containing protein, partial [Verrucomicrobiota bacterium]
LRKKLADERAVPSYIIFSDVSLRQMARSYPANEQEFTRISGVSQKKLEEFGEAFLAEIALHLLTEPRQIFADDSFVAPPAKTHLGDTVRETMKLFRAGQSVEQISRSRGITTGTVFGHLATAIESGENIELNQFFTDEDQQKIAAAFAQCGFGNIVGAKEFLANKFDYGLLRIFRAAAQRK